MQQPSAGQEPPSPPASTGLVERPEPGIARGRWEAPAWAFWVALALVVAASTLYLGRRLGLLRLGRKGKASE